MVNKDNITRFDYCYGCGVCSMSCPQNIISIQLDKEGFYVPKIFEMDECVECGVCLDVCAFNHKFIANDCKPQMSWAAWSNDERVRHKCTSGGVGFEIGKQLIVVMT